jgi:hypothetical protein
MASSKVEVRSLKEEAPAIGVYGKQSASAIEPRRGYFQYTKFSRIVPGIFDARGRSNN